MGAGMKIAFSDNKLALDHAIALAREGHRVDYFQEWRYRYMRLEDYLIGYDIHENLRIVRDVWQSIDEGVDMVFIADVGYGFMGDFIRRRLGIPVYGGCTYGDYLELSRLYAAEVMDDLGIKHPTYYEAIGVDELFDVCEDLEWDCYVKVDMVRGNMETTHIRNENQLMVELEKAGFGPLADKVRFIVSEPVDGVEIGVDAWFNGREFIRPYHFGNEVKGSGCCFGKWVHESVWDDVLDRFEPWLREHNYRGTISFEGIYDGSDIYVIDVTSRIARPAGSLQYYSVKGQYGEIVYKVASGEDVEFEPRATYTVQLAFNMDEPYTWYNIGSPPDNIAMTVYAIGVDGEIWLNTREETGCFVFYLAIGNDFERLVSEADMTAYKYAEDMGIVYSDQGIRKYWQMLRQMREMGIDW